MSGSDTSSPSAVSQAMARRHWTKRRDIRFVLSVALIVGGYQLWGYVTGLTRLTDELAAQLGVGAKCLNIVVTSQFPPEACHMGIYQELGSMRGSSGNSATLYRVRPSGVRELSRYYWIKQIDLAKPEDR